MVKLAISIMVASGVTMILIKKTPLMILVGLEFILNAVILGAVVKFSQTNSLNFLLAVLFFLALAVVETVILTSSQLKLNRIER
ncbi:MAG: hypothetical protein NZM26_05515 [Patescibacteria group bacterium]|nr:hypothetical protein [Patescibacteria group bacterium]